MKHMNTTIRSMLLATLVLSLGACGGDDPLPKKSVKPKIPKRIDVTNTIPNYDQFKNPKFDYVLTHVVPQMQAYYGDIRLLADVEVLGATGKVERIRKGTVLTWKILYEKYVRQLALGCGCYINQLPQGYTLPSSGFGGWAALDYDGFHGYLRGGFGIGQNAYHGWSFADVEFTRLRQRTTFASVINTLVYSNYNFYQTYYTYHLPQYVVYSWPLQHYHTQWPYGYGFNPQNHVSAGFSYNSGSGWSLGVGGFFNFD